MKAATFKLNTILAAVVGLACLVLVLVRAFAPFTVLPLVDIPNLATVSIAALVVDCYLNGKNRVSHCWVITAVLAVLTFWLMPWAAGLTDAAYALRVGVTAPFYLAKLFAPHFAPGAAIVNISSSRDRMSQPQTESYTAAKGGISALTHALAVSLAGRVRVNSISPGWIDTDYTVYEGPDAYQQPAGRVGNPMDIANMVLYLCSDKAGFITGENICIDGGMTRQMIYHGDFGWTLE